MSDCRDLVCIIFYIQDSYTYVLCPLVISRYLPRDDGTEKLEARDRDIIIFFLFNLVKGTRSQSLMGPEHAEWCLTYITYITYITSSRPRAHALSFSQSLALYWSDEASSLSQTTLELSHHYHCLFCCLCLSRPLGGCWCGVGDRRRSRTWRGGGSGRQPTRHGWNRRGLQG